MSIKSLIRKVFRITIHIETMAAREHEVIEPMAPLSIKAEVEPDGDAHLTSSIPSPPREATPELPGAPAEQSGAEPSRSPSPVVVVKSEVEVEVASSGETTVVAEVSSSNTIVSELPASPKREPTISPAPVPSPAPAVAAINIVNSSPRKRRYDELEVVIKEEPLDDDSRPPTPSLDEYPSSHTIIKEDEDEEDEIEFSPKKQRSSLDIDLSSIPPRPALSKLQNLRERMQLAKQQQSENSVWHKDFPDRRPLRCPHSKHKPPNIITAVSKTLRSFGRTYYKCDDCGTYNSFICWADSKGIFEDNPRCNCGYPSREDLTGDTSARPNLIWYKCATDFCKFTYWTTDPLTPEEVNEYCGRINYDV
ncbi:uncharacterized protein F4822DRAFT_431760 [Hypoxylon trugodes]|uniref:uncharacterized protein n=1 Tax=Hypoxylon trugodes TaxID=326681 RepID=UPI00219081C6|nr:uncharacterized protein F4822DRAFT_431760 [Hypoxylon trugodes]KAI1386894.1 hypothetical protein F4822DRAFT_431760 [Hypoxylon trugodes]